MYSNDSVCKHVGRVARPREFREFCLEKPGKTRLRVPGASAGIAFFARIPGENPADSRR